MSAAEPKPCKNAGDDKVHAKRPTVPGVPGPRCATCARERRKAARKAAHGRRLATFYGLTPQEYDALYAAQGGRCAWPKCRATGASRKLAVDHDHSCCSGPVSCGKCVRGLLCGHHNQEIGRNGDDPDVFTGVAAYLRRPPAQAVLLALNDEEGAA